MIVPSGAVRVLMTTRPVDFRKGMDGLAALVCESLRSDPYSGVICVFRAKRAADRQAAAAAPDRRSALPGQMFDAACEARRRAGRRMHGEFCSSEYPDNAADPGAHAGVIGGSHFGSVETVGALRAPRVLHTATCNSNTSGCPTSRSCIYQIYYS